MEDSTKEPLLCMTGEEISDHDDDVKENNTSTFKNEENGEEFKPASEIPRESNVRAPSPKPIEVRSTSLNMIADMPEFGEDPCSIRYISQVIEDRRPFTGPLLEGSALELVELMENRRPFYELNEPASPLPEDVLLCPQVAVESCAPFHHAELIEDERPFTEPADERALELAELIENRRPFHEPEDVLESLLDHVEVRKWSIQEPVCRAANVLEVAIAADVRPIEREEIHANVLEVAADVEEVRENRIEPDYPVYHMERIIEKEKEEPIMVEETPCRSSVVEVLNMQPEEIPYRSVRSPSPITREAIRIEPAAPIVMEFVMKTYALIDNEHYERKIQAVFFEMGMSDNADGDLEARATTESVIEEEDRTLRKGSCEEEQFSRDELFDLGNCLDLVRAPSLEGSALDNAESMEIIQREYIPLIPAEETTVTRTEQIFSTNEFRFLPKPKTDSSPKKKKIYTEDEIKLNLIQEAELHASSPSGDKTDGATTKRCQDIAALIYLDDDCSLRRIINEEPSLPKKDIQRRILEAVELNSLKCLDVLCEKYQSQPTAQTLEHVQLFHRRYGLSFWPLDERPKETALHVLASKISSIKAMEVLEKRPSFLNDFADVQDSHGSTPLLIAIKSNNFEVVKRLLPTKPNMKKKNRNGESPIYVAALNDQVVVITDILRIYSEPLERSEILEIMKDINGDGHSILYAASQSGKPEVLNLLMEQNNWMDFLEIEKKSKEWKTFVCNVCTCGCKILAEIIFKENPGILMKKRDQSFNAFEEVVLPLMRAAEANRYEIVELILDTKPDLYLFTTCDENDRNVFHYAVRNPKVLEYLLLHFITFSEDKEAINKMDKFETTPIKLAAVGNLTESFKMLLNYTTSEGDIFSAHLIHNVDIEVLKMGLHDWREKDPEAVANLLHGDHVEHQPFLEAARKGNIPLMKFFLQEGANYLQRTPNDQTALHYAVLSGKLDAVEYLLDKKEFLAMIDFTDEVNITAAGYATQTGHAEILRCLLDRNAQMKGDKKTNRLNILDSAYGYFKTGENSMREIIQFCTKDKKIKKLQELFEDSYFGPDCIMSKLIEETPNIAMEIFNLCVYQDKYFTHLSYGETKVERRVTYTFFPFKTNHPEGKSNGVLQSIESMVNNNRDNCLGHPLVIRFLNKKMSSSSIKIWFFLNFVFYTMFLLTLTTYGAIQSEGVHSLKSPGMIALSSVILIICGFHFVKEILQMVFSKRDYIKDFENYIEWVMYICAVIYVFPGNSKANVQIAAGAVAVFLGWINFSLFLKRFSWLGIYIIMAKRVFWTVCKVLPLVVLFIVAFSLSLSLIMPTDAGFKTIPISFLTTFVMMTGELDYRDTFLASGPLHVLQKILLVLFILMISIAIMNLLTGLAVDDANEIMTRSKEEKRIYKATLVVTLERTLHNLPFFKTTEIKNYYIEDHPDKEDHSWLLRQWWKLYDDEIEEQLKALADEKEEDYNEEFDLLKDERMENRLSRIEDILTQIQDRLSPPNYRSISGH